MLEVLYVCACAYVGALIYRSLHWISLFCLSRIYVVIWKTRTTYLENTDNTDTDNMLSLTLTVTLILTLTIISHRIVTL